MGHMVRAAIAVGALVALGALVVGVTAGGARIYRIDSDSMRPSLSAGDILFATAAGAALDRGDVVVFADPGGWADRIARLTGSGPVAPTFVKRIVGLPGERVACCDPEGRITVDGEAIDEPYLAEQDTLASILAFDVRVPADSAFVLGDDRRASVDSRYLGVVPLDAILGVERVVIPLH